MKQLHSSYLSSTDHKDLPFDIHTISWMEENHSSKNCAYKLNEHFMIIWVIKGSGSYSANGQKGTLTNNYLLFLKPGEFKNFRLAKGLDGYVVSFSSSFLDLADSDTESIFNNLYRMFAYTNGIGISSEMIDDMQSIVTMMAREFTMHNLYRSEILKRYFKIFLLYLSRQPDIPAQTFRQSRNEELLGHFTSLLERNFRTQKMVADYAAQLAVSPNYLNEVVKKITGRSAGHHIRQRVALEAKRQAIYPNACMKSIAYNLGFFDMAHFSKFFKNTTGMNFTDFKKKDMVLQSVA